MAKVLLVDDDVDIQEINQLVLQRRGHEVTLAYSATEARNRLENARPDIVVLDVMMEHFTAGIELASEINENLPGTPMIMVSGLRGKLDPAPEGFVFDESKLPVMKFLDKPFAPDRLADEIEALLG